EHESAVAARRAEADPFAVEHDDILHAALDETDTRKRLPECEHGRDFLYSSGTTGLPKGNLKPLVPWDRRAIEDTETASWRKSFGFNQ
ncbi:hypothetical protein SB772_42280, partial [Paraburkholderia sp. SIMBA_030]